MNLGEKYSIDNGNLNDSDHPNLIQLQSKHIFLNSVSTMLLFQRQNEYYNDEIVLMFVMKNVAH